MADSVNKFCYKILDSVTDFAAAADGETVVTGTPRLCDRPMGDLLAALRAIGIRCDCLAKPDCLPVRVYGSAPKNRKWRIHAGVSSQFTSSLILLGETSMSAASWRALMPMGFMKSSSRISPG